MNTKAVSYVEAKKIINGWGYKEFTALQDMVFKDCRCGENAREFIIGATSSGKTLIPLVCYKVDKKMLKRKEKLLYMVPYRALATQKEREFRLKFPVERTIISTSEYCSEDINVMEGNCDIAIVIYEKIFMFLSNNKDFLSQYTHIVFDELGIVENSERGLKADYILYMACRHSKNNIYILATPYFNWEKYISTYAFHKHQEISRPVEIKEKKITYSLGERGHECDEMDVLIFELSRKHRELGHKILIFANSRSRVRDLSQKLYHYFCDGKSVVELDEAKRNFLSKLIMTDDDLYGIMDRDDYLAYETGITYHNASLPEEVRELIESEFLSDDGRIDIVVATETLAYGLNSNVDVVLVTEMEKPAGDGKRKFLTVNEYLNYIGRAGRLGKKDVGYAYTFINDEQQSAWEELNEKKLAPDFIESQYKYIWDREECIFHLLNYFDQHDGIETEKVLNNLQSFPYSHTNEVIDIDNPIKELKQRKLIIEVVDELDDINKLKVSKIGTRALGFIISIDTYDRLIEAAKQLFVDRKIFILDFLYAISQCKELQMKDYYTPHNAKNYRSHLIEWLNLLEQNGQISAGCKKNIINNPSIHKFKNEENRFGYRDFAEIRKVRIAEALFMWIECYSVEEIKKRCGFDYGIIKKLGEKAKYVTDILSADISMSGNMHDLEIQLKQIGISLYYGIKRELISGLNLLELEPLQGRQLRTVGRINNIREHYSKTKAYKLGALLQHIASFPDEYKILVEGD